MFLKWKDTTIGKLDNNFNLHLVNSNSLSRIYFKKDTGIVDKKVFDKFILDRIISSDRRDIEKMLFRLGLASYDKYKIAYKTRCINPNDLFWIARNENEIFKDVLQDTVTEYFNKPFGQNGGSAISPGGFSIKWYGDLNGNYGVFKRRVHNYSSDLESEVAVYELSKLLGVDCCKAVMSDNSVFSMFEYNFLDEYIVHVRQFFDDGEITDNLYSSLKDKFPMFIDNIRKMIILDFITRQEDRHMSNYAIKIGRNNMSMYKLYDNGRSLFYESKEDFIQEALSDIYTYSTEFGLVGNYFDVIKDIAEEVDITSLVNLNLSKDKIFEVYKSAGIPEERLEGCVEWSYKCINILKTL